MALILTADQMRAVDKAAADELGLPSLVLMENAGRGVVEAIVRARGSLRGREVRVVCGGGQNGGDGFVIARHLTNAGARVQILLTAPRAKIAGDAAINLRVVEAMSIPLRDGSTEIAGVTWRRWLDGADLIIDAVLGTGLRAEVAGPAVAAIQAMNETRAFRVSVDVPSGLDADSGRVRGVTVRADLTVTMGCRKLGLVLDPEVPVGRLEVADLGLSPGALAAAVPGIGPLCHWLDAADLRSLLPRRRPGAHKRAAGHVLVVAGSPGKTGAALLAANGALRGGAGLATIASTGPGQVALDAKVLEAMTASYASGDDADEASYDRIAVLASRMSAVVLGPGIPTGSGMRALVSRIAAELPLPVLLDADALNLLGTDAAVALGRSPAPRIVTPHPGEMARIVGTTPMAIQEDRLGHARRLAAASGAVVVLKGARTIVAAPDRTAYVNPTANPALATAGSGDVLAGLIGALAGQGLGPVDAARAGVFVHGQAADVAVSLVGGRNIVAGDLPLAIARTLEREIAAGDNDGNRPDGSCFGAFGGATTV